MFNHKDDECQDEQFDGFKTDWSLRFECIFTKADNIKHIRDGIFETKDGKQIKIYPTVYLDGKVLTPVQAQKLGFEPQSIVTGELERYDD